MRIEARRPPTEPETDGGRRLDAPVELSPDTWHKLPAQDDVGRKANLVIDSNAYVTYGGPYLTLALVNAGPAESKGRSRMVLWSLLLGPIATFLIVVWARPADS